MRVLFGGDSHADSNYIDYLYFRAKKMSADRIFVLGDFGFWPRMAGGVAFLEHVREVSEDYGIPLYWLDGNHEDHEKLADLTGDGHIRDRFIPTAYMTSSGRQVADKVLYSPRGHVWEWDGITFGSMGGAFSIDRDFRDLGFDFFYEELITVEDVNYVKEQDKRVDVMLSHDTPASVDMAAEMMMHGRQPNTGSNRDLLEQVRSVWQPRTILHGHWHLCYSQAVGDFTSRGLDCNMKPSKSWTLLDTEGMLVSAS